MENYFDPPKTKYIETEKKSIFFKSISIFFMMIFLLFPLAEIVTEFDYHYMESFPSYPNCSSILDFKPEVLSFKPIN